MGLVFRKLGAVFLYIVRRTRSADGVCNRHRAVVLFPAYNNLCKSALVLLYVRGNRFLQLGYKKITRVGCTPFIYLIVAAYTRGNHCFALAYVPFFIVWRYMQGIWVDFRAVKL